MVLPIHPLLYLQRFLQVRITVTAEHRITTTVDIARHIIHQLHITGVRLQLFTLPIRLLDLVMVQVLRLFHREYVLPVIIGCLIPVVGVCQMEEHLRRLRQVHHIRRMGPVQPGIIPVQQVIIGTVQIVLPLLVLLAIRKVVALTITTGMVQVVFNITAKPIALTLLEVATLDFIGMGLVVSRIVLIADQVIIGMVPVVL